MLFFFFLTILLSSAQTISVIAPCSNQILWRQELSELPRNLGVATVTSLEASGLQFQGTERGINQINHSPIGRGSMEIISATEMYSYGWCYSVNGVIPEGYPHEIELNADDQVVWFYGFAHYQNGEWISQCEDSILRRQQKFCQNP
jgi:hypothetical protein